MSAPKLIAPKLIIVADDLTGAADSAARCVHLGLSAEIWFEAPATQGKLDTPSAADVIALSTDSRYLLPEQAAERVTATVSGIAAWAGATWYKKIDSTFRGNLGAEIDAMLAALPDCIALISPGFPAQGRGLAEGKLVYAGAVPLHLPTLLREQSRLPVGEIGLATVRQGVTALKTALQQNRQQGARLVVVDAMTERDLDVIVGATRTASYLLCGSAGMVAPLAARWQANLTATAGSTAVPAGPILAVVGSGCEMAHAQVAQVAAAGSMRVRVLRHDWYEMDLVGAQSHPVGDWLIHLEAPGQDAELEGPVARAQAARLADLTFAAVDKLQPSALLVVGGDTAHHVLKRLGIERLLVVEELLPGIALTFGTDNKGHRRAVILKPGNFGDAQTLLTLQNALRERQKIV